MDSVLTTDVQGLIVGTYASSYEPLVALSCKRWRAHVHEHQIRRAATAAAIPPRPTLPAGIEDYPVLRELCCRKPHSRSVRAFLKQRQKVTPLKIILVELAERGDVDLFKWILDMRGILRMDIRISSLKMEVQTLVITRAAYCGQMDFLKTCYTLWGVWGREFDVIKFAARGGHTSIVQLCHDQLRDRGVVVDRAMDDAMVAAARGGHEHIVRLCHTSSGVALGLCDVDLALAQAARGGHEDLMCLLHNELGATNVDWALIRAARGGHERLVRMIHDEWKATDVDKAMIAAARGGHEHIVRLCRDVWGATDVDAVFTAAIDECQPHIAWLCWNEWALREDAIARVRNRYKDDDDGGPGPSAQDMLDFLCEW